MTRCANPECPVPVGQRLTQPCLLNTGGMPDVIGSPCTSFVGAEPLANCTNLECDMPVDLRGSEPCSFSGQPYTTARVFTCTRFVAAKPRVEDVTVIGHEWSMAENGERFCKNCAATFFTWRVGEPCPTMNKATEPPVECSGCKLFDYCEDQVDDETICTRYVPKERGWAKRGLGQASRDVDSWPHYLRGSAIHREAQPSVEPPAGVADVAQLHGYEPGPSMAGDSTNAQPPVECKHEDVLVSIKGSAFRHPMSGEATCADCDAPMVVRPASQWAAVTELVEKWRERGQGWAEMAETQRDAFHRAHSNGRATTHRSLAAELEQVTKEENDG